MTVDTMSSDDFFQNMGTATNNPSSSSSGGGGGVTRRTAAPSRAPPPPPPPPAAVARPSSTTTTTARIGAGAGTGAASSYYGRTTTASGTTTQQQRPTADAPLAPRARASRPPPAAAAATASRPLAPSYYGSSGGGVGYTGVTSTFPSTSSTPTGGATSYYSAQTAAAPAAVVSTTAPAHYSSNVNADSSGWYSAAPSPAVADTGWYSDPGGGASQPQPQPQQPLQPPVSTTPSYTNFIQPQPLGPTTYLPERAPNSYELAGAMDAQQSQQPLLNIMTPTVMLPSSAATMKSTDSIMMDEDYQNEPPLLEELGVNMSHILAKTRAVVLPLARLGHTDSIIVVQDDSNDLAGPLFFCLLLGGECMLTGKFQFGYIYGFAMFGCWSMTLILNLLSPSDAVSVWTVASILGYALLPVNLLALVKIFLLGYLKVIGKVLAILVITWCTVASTRLLEQKCSMRDQRYLMAYPIALLYSAFVMITIF